MFLNMPFFQSKSSDGTPSFGNFCKNNKWYPKTLLDLLRKFLKLIQSLKYQTERVNFCNLGICLTLLKKLYL